MPASPFPLCILVGMPGSGKTTVGRHLARRMGLVFVDSDHVIEERIACSIREYFDRHGEEAFRELEEQVLDELTSGRQGGVISTGGGAVLRPANRKRLHQRGRVVYLHSTPEEIFRRIRHDRTRPLLQVANPMDRLRSLYAARDPLYREVAHHVMQTGRTSIDLLVSRLLMQLEMDMASAEATPAPADASPSTH